jgi:hypothetical protein
MGDIIIKSENALENEPNKNIYSSNDSINFFLNKGLVFVCFIYRNMQEPSVSIYDCRNFRKVHF